LAAAAGNIELLHRDPIGLAMRDSLRRVIGRVDPRLSIICGC
jgi:hypothetical protein